MTSTAKLTKAVTLSQEFRRAMAGNETSALAYMIMSSFGVSLASCISSVSKMIETKAGSIIMLCLAASVQIRGNVTFVGRDYGDVRTKFPELVIEGTRVQTDQFNFGALHVCGQVLCNITKHEMGKRMLAKAGDCTIGKGFTDNEAGKVNKDIFESWGVDDKLAYRQWLESIRPDAVATVDAVFATIKTGHDEFAKKLDGKQEGSATGTKA